MKILTMFLFDLFLSMYYVFFIGSDTWLPKNKSKDNICTYNMENSVGKQTRNKKIENRNKNNLKNTMINL